MTTQRRGESHVEVRSWNLKDVAKERLERFYFVCACVCVSAKCGGFLPDTFSRNERESLSYYHKTTPADMFILSVCYNKQKILLCVFSQGPTSNTTSL